MTDSDVLRYLTLVDRRLDIIMHSGIGWKPEYGPELEAIDRELAMLREMVNQEHEKRRHKKQRKGGGRMIGNDLISRRDLMDSLRGNVLVDVTPGLEQAVMSQPAACDIDGIFARIEDARDQLEKAMEIVFE